MRVIKDIKKIIPFINLQTLIMFDIDNTLIYSKQYKGSDAWFSHHVNLVKQNHDDRIANNIDELVSIWVSMISSLIMLPCQEDTVDIVNSLIDKNNIVFLTSRGPNCYHDTMIQLKQNGFNIDMDVESIVLDDKVESRPCGHGNYIVHSSGKNKGKILRSFLDSHNIENLTDIMAIDDKKQHLINIKEEFSDIPTILFYYNLI